jgi:uncharacterized membrane protein YqjE
MQTPQDVSPHLTEACKHVAQRLLVICENRIHLLMVELEQERERIMGALMIAFGAMVLGMLAMFTLTAIIVIAFWHWSPLLVLTILTVLYGGTSGLLYARLARWQREWRLLAGTLEQIKKDRECLANLV